MVKLVQASEFPVRLLSYLITKTALLIAFC